MTTETITRDIFEHLVQLAALELSAEEAEYLRQQLYQQLKSIRELQAIPVDDRLPLNLHGIAYPSQICPEIRDDQWCPFPHPEEILAQAPETQDNYIVVPEIPHTELS